MVAELGSFALRSAVSYAMMENEAAERGAMAESTASAAAKIIVTVSGGTTNKGRSGMRV